MRSLFRRVQDGLEELRRTPLERLVPGTAQEETKSGATLATESSPIDGPSLSGKCLVQQRVIKYLWRVVGRLDNVRSPLEQLTNRHIGVRGALNKGLGLAAQLVGNGGV